MIDIHSHILYGLDDGAKTLEESIEMFQIGFNDGLRIIVAPPHTLNSVYVNSRSTIFFELMVKGDNTHHSPPGKEPGNRPQLQTI